MHCPLIHLKRIRTRLGLLTSLVLLVVALPTHSLLAEERFYLSNTNLGLELLPPPPLPGSPEQAADLGEVSAVARGRTDAETALAQSERIFFIFSFTPAIGSFFQSNNLPQTVAFFRRVQQETDRIAGVTKGFWKRPRPYEVDTNLFSGFPDTPRTSYPSAHSTRGTVYALLLAELFPDRRDAILAIGRQIGWHRVQLGMHYPSDIYAGRVLGQAIVRQLKEKRSFRRDFKAVQKEIAAYTGMGR